MRLKMIIITGVLFLASQVCAEESLVLKTQRDKVNYGIGVNIINNIKKQGVEIDLDIVMRGMKDASSGGELLLKDDELNQAILQYQRAVRQKQGTKAKIK